VTISELYVGIMSGTSLDGIDVALVELSDGQVRLVGTHYQAYEQPLKDTLLALHQPAINELHLAQITGNNLARHYAGAVTSLLQKYAISPEQIRAVGCHGQTIRHRPENGYTIQLGNASLLAELTCISVVSDFRSRDISAGGQGAPLVPAFHDKVLRHPDIHRVIVNIGGISNLTDLRPGGLAAGFDCGPGNLLMDGWCMRHLGKAYDDQGNWAVTGQVLPALLGRMLKEPFFSLPPPKSSGRDLFNTQWLQDKLQGDERAEDVQATLLELTCRTIAQAVQQYCAGAKEIYLCGGGAHNQTLLNRLVELQPDCIIRTTQYLGIDSDYLEAIAFAWLAQQALQGKPANLPIVTGAKHPCVLGAIYPA
jgi:anhydro-N-acetylmuramic acid kinase